MSAVSWPEEAPCDGDGIKVAVDVDGELAALERALRLAEKLLVQMRLIAARRQHAEDTERDRRPEWLGSSARRMWVERAQQDAACAAESLEKAMRANGTIDDEIPF